MKTVIIHASSQNAYKYLTESAFKTGLAVKKDKTNQSFTVTSAPTPAGAKKLDQWVHRRQATNPLWLSKASPPRPLFLPKILRALDAPAFSPASARVFTCKEYASIYSFPPPPPATLPGDLVVISVVSFGGGLFGTASPPGSDGLSYISNGDVQAHWAGLDIFPNNMPHVAVKTLLSARNDPAGDLESTGENTLDVEMIGACYPSAGVLIILFISPNSFSAFANAVAQAASFMNILHPVTKSAVTVQPRVVSISWGAPETAFGSTLCKQINAVMKNITASGEVTICAASGDDGAKDGTPELCCDFPSSSPHIIACGGTSLKCPDLSRAAASTVETAWTGTGGGVSRYFSKPAYQLALSGTARHTPDIAMNADPKTGVWFTINGAMVPLGGTSIVAPAFAALIALTKPRSFLAPILYSLAATPTFYDIVHGSNNGYNAGTGYDNCSGLGSVNGSVFAAYVASNVPLKQLSVSPVSAKILSSSKIVIELSPVTKNPPEATVKALSWTSNNRKQVIPFTDSAGTTSVTLNAPSDGTFVVSATDLSEVSASLSIRLTTLSTSQVVKKFPKSLTLPPLASFVSYPYMAIASFSPRILQASLNGTGTVSVTAFRKGSVRMTAIGYNASKNQILVSNIKVTVK